MDRRALARRFICWAVHLCERVRLQRDHGLAVREWCPGGGI